MKIRVISEFYDKFHTSTLFKVGAVLDFEEKRAQDVIQRGLAVAFEEPKPKKEEPKAEPKPKKEEVKEAPKAESEKKAEVKAEKKAEKKADDK